jgi:hypothetical protein
MITRKPLPLENTYVFDVHPYEGNKKAIRVKARRNDIAYERARKRCPNMMLIELDRIEYHPTNAL